MSQYRSILKATSIFGGTQILQILITLVRAKFVALLIGSEGMGYNAMYTTSLVMITTIFGMGLNTSVIRDLSKANDEGDEIQYSIVIKVFNRMLYILSFLGSIFVILFSPLLSNWSFGNYEHVLDFVLLSIVVFFTLLSQGNQANLIGKRRIKDTAICSLIGSIVSLITAIPFFYFWRLNGIIPGIIVSNISNYLVTYYFSKKIKIQKIKITWHDVKTYGFSIFSLGFSLVIAVLIGNVTVYAINVGITRIGGISDLGLYNAGISMTQQAISMVFSAMIADYFPRLVASLKDNKLMSQTINEQTEILIYLSVPVLVLFSICSPLIIQILLTDEFLVINSFIRILCFGMYMKALGYAQGNLSFAKGDKVFYLSFEGGYGNAMNLILSISFYYFWGLKGIAFAFVTFWSLYYLLIININRFRYKYSCSGATFKIIALNTLLMILLLFSDLLFSNSTYYVCAVIIAILSIPYNLFLLNKKTDLLNVIIEKVTIKK